MSGGTVSYTINIGANISKVKEAMKEVSQLLSSSNLDKGITSSYERKLGKLSNALLELENKASQPIKTDAELRDVERSIKKVTNLTSELGLSFKELQGKDLSKVFGDFTKPVQNLKDYIKEFDKLQKKFNDTESNRNSKRLAYQTDILNKQKEIDAANLRKQAAIDKNPERQKNLENQINRLNAEKKALEATKETLERDIASPRGTINKFSKNDLLKNLVEADQALLKFKNDYKDLLDKNEVLTKSKVKKEDRQKYDFEALRAQYKQLQENRALALKEAEPVFLTGKNKSQQVDVEAELNKYKDSLEKYKEISEQLANTRQQISEKQKKAKELENDKNSDPTASIDKEIDALEKAKEKLEKELNTIDTATKTAKTKLQKSFDELKNSFKEITKNDSFDKLEYNEDNFKKLQEFANNFASGQFAEAAKQLQNLGISFENLSDNAGDLKGKVGPVFDEMSRAKEMSDDFEHLTWRLKYFFSLAGGFNLMRRAIRSAVTTTKELDAAMTQTAVVSTYTVSDMWKTLPKYSKEASKLGVAIKDVYNAQTLYVQQGLDMNTAMDIGVETMKMARVAGIGAEEATNSMTAALRGFNMAIDEKSAQRINDVYSKLAQNTASNTQEISTAMTKTAALANSANMSFENTAAFLATIIESTREGAETAGTALKTVIARFTEVKSLYTKNQLTGTDEEGQEIDVNKISKALRTAGINMNEFFTGAKGLDQIFKELGSKWNNLSTVQQRYIATQAAGSRQQSRFLALMQNYERTVELTEMAYNSAGSGQEQFEKTLDSLAAKTEQLKNSWDTLLMGLANSEAIKGIVDFGTDILNVINKIIDALSGSSGLTKALATLSIGMGVFKAGRGAFGKGGLFSYLLGGKEISTRVSRTLVGGIVTSLKTAKTTPELGAALGSTISNSFKRNFQLWGQGPNILGQYLPKDQLEQLKADTEEYQRIINNIDRNRRGAESYRENLEAGKVKLPSGLTKEQALEKNQQEINDFNKQKQQVQENFVKEQKEKGFSDSTIKTAMENPEQIQKATVNYKALGNAILLAGVGLAGLASLMRNTGEASQEAVASVEALSTGFTTMAMTMKLLQSIGSTVGGLSFLSGGWGTAIAAAVGAIVTIVGVVDALTESVEEKQKRINETISKNQTHIKDLENEYKQVDDSLGSIIQKQEDLNKLTEGTLAWKDAVKELNTEIQTLVQNFPDFSSAVEIGDNGSWTINTGEVRRIQKEKQEEINRAKQADLALQYTKQLDKISQLKSKKFYEELQRTRAMEDMSGENSSSRGIYEELIGILENIDYSKISLKNLKALEAYLEMPNAPKEYGELPEKYKWLKSIIPEESIKNIVEKYDQNFPVFSRTMVQGLIYYKQKSDIEKETEATISSSMTSYLLDELDEKLPQELYGGVFRKFILNQAKELIKDIKVQELTPEEYAAAQSEYYDKLGYEKIGDTWQYKTSGEEVEKLPKQSEVEQYAAIMEYFGQVEGIIDYFVKNKDDFTLGKLSLGSYQKYILPEDATEELDYDSIEIKLAQYYVDKFDSFNKLMEEIGYGDNFDDTITADMVSQIDSIIRDTKNNFGKDAATDVASFIDILYTSLLDEVTGELDKNAFSRIISGIESGTIINQDQLIEKLEQVFLGFGDSFVGDFESVRKYLTRMPSISKLIENFADELSFIDSMYGEKIYFTQEEKDKLLKTGKYREVNFKDQGVLGFELVLGKSEDIAADYSDYLQSNYTELIQNLERALQLKKTFDTAIAESRESDITEIFKDFINNDFSKIEDKELLQIIKNLGIESFYNPNTNGIISLEELGESGVEILRSTLLPQLFTGDYDELSTQLSILKRQAGTLEGANQMSSSDYARLTEYITGIKKARGERRSTHLLDQLLEWNEGEIFTEIEGDNKFSQFLDAIDKLDWSNINSIEDFQKALKNQGVALDNSAGQLEDLFETFKEIYKLGKIITADEIKQLAQYGLQLKDEIKNKTDAAYTKEQRDFLVYAQKELADQFVYNAETGGYTYIGGDKKALEKVAQNAAVTTRYEQLQAQYILSQPQKRGSDEYKQALKTLFGVESLEGLPEERRQEIQDELDNFYEDATFIAEQYEEATEGLKYAGLNNDQVRMEYGSSENQQIATTITDATKAGLNTQELINYANTLKNITEQQEETQTLSDAMAYAIAYDNMLMNQGLQELASNFSTWKEALKLEGTPEYSAAVEGLRQSLQKLTGTTYKFTDEFLTSTEALDLFAKAAKGDVKALADLKKAAAKDIIKPEDLGEAGQKISDWINNLDLENIKIGAELETNVADVFQGLLDAGILTAEQVTSALEGINYQPNVQMVPISGSAAASAHTHAYLRSSDGGYTEIEGEENIAQQETVYVPVIGGSTKGNSYGLAPTVSKGGTGQTVTPPKGGGGGGGKKFKNDFDKYYNQVEDINELERQRNLLEKDYNQLLKSENVSGKDIYNNLKKQLDLLEKRKKLTADLAEKRKGQLFDAMKDEEYKDVWKYAKWNDEDQTIEIDWDAINKITDSEEGELVKEYVKKLEEFQGKYDDMINALEDIEDSIQEIKDRGREQYSTLEERVRDALIKQIQDKIDELTEVDRAITDTNQKLFDSINQALELQRQERTNAETEEELADKEQRLVYLQQDSSNANQVEIAKLQEELADARQDYTDNLIDQKISELQRQNDEAAEQRQEQIALMQQSLDWQEKNGAFWAEVNSLIGKGVNEEGQLVHGSELEDLLKKGEAWDSLSTEGRMAWMSELEELVAQGIAYLSMTRQLEDLGVKSGTKVSFTTAGQKYTKSLDENDQVTFETSKGTVTGTKLKDSNKVEFRDSKGNIIGYGTVDENGNVTFQESEGKTLTGTVDKDGNVIVKNADGTETVYKNVFQDYDGNYRTFEDYQPTGTTPSGDSGSGDSGSSGGSGRDQLDGHGWYTDENYHWHKTKSGKTVDKQKHDFMTINTSMAHGKQCKVCYYLKDWSDVGHEGTYTGDPADDNRPGRTTTSSPTTEGTRGFNGAAGTFDAKGNLIQFDDDGNVISTPKQADLDSLKEKPFTTATYTSKGTSSSDGYDKDYNEPETAYNNPLENELFNLGYNEEQIAYLESQADSVEELKRKGLIPGFATGGLANFTGPAWLDGTHSNPELVLNARDTQNFIELKDTLASLKSNGGFNLNGGDNYYDIKVQVDSLGSDYDVDKAIDRIKARIAQDNAYRNVNTLSRLR